MNQSSPWRDCIGRYPFTIILALLSGLLFISGIIVQLFTACWQTNYPSSYSVPLLGTGFVGLGLCGLHYICKKYKEDQAQPRRSSPRLSTVALVEQLRALDPEGNYHDDLPPSYFVIFNQAQPAPPNENSVYVEMAVDCTAGRNNERS